MCTKRIEKTKEVKLNIEEGDEEMAMVKIKCIHCENEEVVKNRRKAIGVHFFWFFKFFRGYK